jgi:amidohydrolase
MIKDGCLEGIQEVYGLHNTDLFSEGLVGLKSGPLMSSIADIFIRVKGKGAHSSVPHMAKDVISAGAAIIQNLHLIQSRHVASHENFALTITKFHGGDCNNVFPDEATLEGTIRCFSNEVYQSAISKIREVVETSASMLSCTADVEFNAYRPAVVNHPK